MLTALQERFFESEPFKVFCKEFTAAVNETRMEAHAAAKAAIRERAKIDSEITKLIQALKDGFTDLLRQRSVEARRQKALRGVSGGDAVVLVAAAHLAVVDVE